ncbi:eukaryotic translation initiation factor 4G-like [Aphis craccivora]|uniref:Eukaryotic translation initiation factor 4G-like n=1 Tax=Aphis craccivora TaxID=307492 RepID=A0A6G0ZM63_APHCR|nr:eukaryotic translation initiation factor 4G-like [Aphis craccivora]
MQVDNPIKKKITMEQINNSVEILNIAKSVVHHLNNINLANMTRKIIALPINNINLLEEITDIIYDRALQRQNYTHIYADMCASLINDSTFNKFITNTKISFQKVLLKKCSDVFYTLTKYNPQELKKLKQKMQNKNMEQKMFIDALNSYQFKFNKKVISNCRFISELYRKGAIPEKIILSCITDLSYENEELQLHCLCIILQLTGPILSKAYDLNEPVNTLLFAKDNYEMSSTLKFLILKVQKMHSEDWIIEEPVKYIGNNYMKFSDLPKEMKNMYTLKSYNIMALLIFNECYDVLFNFVNNKKIDEVINLLKMNKFLIRYDPISFIVSMILVALEENQNIRNYAGKLLDNIVKKKLLSKYSIQSGVDKVLNDLGIKEEYPNLSNLLLDITSQFKF